MWRIQRSRIVPCNCMKPCKESAIQQNYGCQLIVFTDICVIYTSFLLSFSQTLTWNSKLPTMNAYMTSLKILSPISNRCLVRKWTVSIYRCRIIKLLPTFLITSRFFFLRVVVLDPSLTKILLNKNENIEVLPWDRLFERCLYIFVFALWVVVPHQPCLHVFTLCDYLSLYSGNWMTF